MQKNVTRTHLVARAMALAFVSTMALTSVSALAQTAVSGTTDNTNGANAAGSDSTAVGDNSTASGSESTALGGGATASGLGSTAVGATAQASAGYSIAVGTSSSVASSAFYGIAVGQGAQIQTGATYGVAIGAGSYVASGDTKSVAIGFLSTTTRSNEFSVGSVGLTRVVSNVSAGTLSTDAVNLGQLQSEFASAVTNAVAQAKTYTDQQIATVSTSTPSAPSTPPVSTVSSSSGTSNMVAYTDSKQTDVSLGNGTTPVTVHNVAAGVANTDAVNVAQLNDTLQSANSYTNQQVSALNQEMNSQFSQVNNRIDNLSNRVDGIGAMAAAIGSNMFDAGDHHDTQIGVGVATYRGATGYSVGVFRRISSNAAANIKVSGATHSGGVAVGAGFNAGF